MTIRERLKRETRERHEAVEAHLGFLMADDVSREQYAALLVRMLGFYEPLEANLARMLGDDDLGLNFDARRKSPWLHRDLAELGVNAGSECPYVPRPASVADAVGCLYVLEGATLGGRVISPHLKRRLPNLAHHFFSGYGDLTGERFRQFGDVLERCGGEDAVVAAAIATFEAMERWLNAAVAREKP